MLLRPSLAHPAKIKMKTFEGNLVSKVPTDALLEACLADKKTAGGKLHLVVPRAIGQCTVIPMEPEELRTWLE